MKLQEVFDQLSAGEFSNLSIGGEAQGVVNDANYARVVGHINLGLTALHRRFNLKQGTLLLQMQEDQVRYKLSSAFAVNAARSQEPVRYIIDSAENKFLDDIIKVEAVTGSEDGELSLNDAADPMSVMTPSALVLEVPACLDTQDLTITYRANHPKIVVGLGYFDPARVDVELPDTHLPALLYYVASRVNNPVGMSNEFHAGNSYAAKYEAECQELEGRGLQVDLGQSDDRLVRNGWA